MSSTAELTGTPNAPGEKSPPVRYRFRITIEGVVLLIVIMLVGFAAWHSGTNLLYLIFAILISFYLLHGAMLWLNLRKLTVSQSMPENVISGQPLTLEVTVSNAKSWLHSYSLTVRHHTSLNKKQPPVSVLYFPVVPAKGSDKKNSTILLTQRGICPLPRVTVATRYPFGFEERTSVNSTSDSVLVLPATFNVSGLLNNKLFGLGDQESNERGPGTDLFGLRKYQPGDHARSIHWKTTARARKLIVSEFARDERKQATLIINNSIQAQPSAHEVAAFEKAIVLTASIARHLLNSGFEVGLKTVDSVTPVAQGSVQLYLILKHLALLQFTAASAQVLPDDSTIYIEFMDRPGTALPPYNHVIDSRKWQPAQSDSTAGDPFL